MLEDLVTQRFLSIDWVLSMTSNLAAISTMVVKHWPSRCELPENVSLILMQYPSWHINTVSPTFYPIQVHLTRVLLIVDCRCSPFVHRRRGKTEKNKNQCCPTPSHPKKNQRTNEDKQQRTDSPRSSFVGKTTNLVTSVCKKWFISPYKYQSWISTSIIVDCSTYSVLLNATQRFVGTYTTTW